MKRDLRLRPLSRDHHHALALAKRATGAAADGDPGVLEQTWNEVLRKFDDELVPHFEIEERWLLPPLEAAGASALVERVLADHRALRDLAGASGAGVGQRLAEFGARLTEHVKFEERVLFPAAEASLTAEALQAVEDATHPPSARREP